MKRAGISLLGLLVITAGGGFTAARAQTGVASIAALQGVVEVQRGKSWIEVGSGDEIIQGAHLRTGTGSRAKLLFRDDTVLDLGASSDLSIETLDNQSGKRHATLQLNKGRVHAWVGEQYKEAKARFEIETPTAVAAARGTEFIVVYSPETELTEVVGIVGEVEVFGRLAVLSGGIEVGPNAYTQVQKGRFPTPIQQLDALRFRQFFEGLELRGTGRRDGLNVDHPLVAGRLLSKEDVPAIAVATQEPLPDSGGRPLQPSAWTRSADIYTNRQPLRQYRLNPPGRLRPSGPGGVIVDF